MNIFENPCSKKHLYCRMAPFFLVFFWCSVTGRIGLWESERGADQWERRSGGLSHDTTEEGVLESVVSCSKGALLARLKPLWSDREEETLRTDRNTVPSLIESLTPATKDNRGDEKMRADVTKQKQNSRI